MPQAGAMDNVEELESVRTGLRKELTIRGPADSVFDDLLETIEQAPKLESIAMQGGNGLSTRQLCRFAEALGKRSDVASILFAGQEIAPEAATKLTAAFSNQQKLHTLVIRDCGIGDEALIPLCKYLSQESFLYKLEWTDNSWTQAGHDRLAKVLQYKPQLSYVKVEGKQPLDDNGMVAALITRPHPNLIITDVNNDLLNSFISRNMNHINRNEQVLPRFKTIMEKKPEERKVDGIVPRHLYSIEAQWDAICFRKANMPNKYHHYGEFLKELPKLPDGAEPTVENLLRPGQWGFCPAENPLVWQEHPDLLERLGWSGQLSPSILTRPTERHSSLIQAAYAFRPAAEVTQTLNGLGIRVMPEMLMEKPKQAKELLKIIEYKDGIAPLLSRDNWVGASPAELRRFLAAIPDDMQPYLPPANNLIYTVEAAWNRNQQGAAGHRR